MQFTDPETGAVRWGTPATRGYAATTGPRRQHHARTRELLRRSGGPRGRSVRGRLCARSCSSSANGN